MRVEDLQMVQPIKTWHASGKYGDYYSTVTSTAHTFYRLRLVGSYSEYIDFLHSVDWGTYRIQLFPYDTGEGIEYQVDGYITSWQARQRNNIVEAEISLLTADLTYVERTDALEVPPAFNEVPWSTLTASQTIVLSWLPYPLISATWWFMMSASAPRIYMAINPDGFAIEFSWLDQLNAPGSYLANILTGVLDIGNGWKLYLRDYRIDSSLRVVNQAIYTVQAYASKEG